MTPQGVSVDPRLAGRLSVTAASDGIMLAMWRADEAMAPLAYHSMSAADAEYLIAELQESLRTRRTVS